LFPESQRIKLLPLTVEEIDLYRACDFSFENHFGLIHHPREMDPNVQRALKEKVIPSIQKDPENHLLYTLWVAIDKQINKVVAGIVFKGPPDIDNKIEFGAGTLAGFMNHGYMTEVTRMMCLWTREHFPTVKIIAQTKTDNYASQATLRKCEFIITEQKEEYWNWEWNESTSN
jgi:ribosomal-protein-alanine N-acetyltransferase